MFFSGKLLTSDLDRMHQLSEKLIVPFQGEKEPKSPGGNNFPPYPLLKGLPQSRKTLWDEEERRSVADGGPIRGSGDKAQSATTTIAEAGFLRILNAPIAFAERSAQSKSWSNRVQFLIFFRNESSANPSSSASSLRRDSLVQRESPSATPRGIRKHNSRHQHQLSVAS